MRFVPLDTVVRNILSLMGDVDGTRYVQVMRACLIAAEELNLTGIPFYETVQEQISDNYTIALPKDVIKVLRVGTLDNSGKLSMFGEDKGIRRMERNKALEDPACDTAPDTSNLVKSSFSNETPSVLFYNFNFKGQYLGEYYGVKNRQHTNGTYRFNQTMSSLEFGTGGDVFPGQTVLVEYKRSLGDDAHRLVPLEWQTAMYYRVLQFINAGSDPSSSMVNYRQFVTEFRNVKRQAIRMNAKDLIAAIEEHRQGGPKY